MKTILVPLALLALCAGATADTEAALKQKRAAETAMSNAIAAMNQATADGDAAKIQAARSQLMQADMNYRFASRNYHEAALQEKNEDARKRFVYDNKAEYTRRRIDNAKAIVDLAKQRTDMNAEERAGYLSSNEASLRAMYIDSAINESYVNEYNPTRERMGDTGTLVDHVVDSKTRRMSDLLSELALTDANSSYGQKDFADEVDKMTKRIKVEESLREYRSLAASGQFRNPATGELLSPTQQSRVEANAMKAAEDKIRSLAHDGGLPEDFVNFFTGEKKDSRLELASQLAYENRSNIAGQALHYIDNKDASPQEHFRAMALTINQRANELDEFYTNQYLPSANDGQDNVLSQWANLGMGTATRSIFDESETGLTTVRRKIDAVKADGYKVAALLNEAASVPVSQLSANDRDLLMNYGYVGRDSEGNFQYQVPKSSRDINEVMDVDLPKSPWMDAVSVRSAVETGAGMATGMASAQLATKLASVANLGSKGAAALSTLIDVTASSSVDSLINTLHGNDADFDQALLHNLTMAGAGKLMGAGGEEFLNSNKSWRDAIEDTSSRTAYRQLKDALTGKNKLLENPDIKRFIANSVGLSSEAAIETAYQAALQDGPIDRDAFMANLVSGAISKTAAMAIHGGSKNGSEKLIEKLPESLRQWARNNPKAMLEAIERANKSEAHADAAVSRFDAIKRQALGTEGFNASKGNDAEIYRDPAFADHVLESLKKGELNWADLGIIAEREGSVVSDLLHEIKDRRTEWAYGVREPDAARINDAARKAIESDYENRMEAIRSGDGSIYAKGLELDRLQKEKAAVLEQLKQDKQDKSAAGRDAGKALADAKKQLFNDDVMEHGIGKQVKERALRELDREYALKQQELMTGENRPKTKKEMKERLAALEVEKEAHAKSILAAEMKAPGSGDPTSDIDRSWSEPRVVQAMKNLQRDRLMLENNGVMGVGPTTAKAFDLNEYYDVMEGVKTAMPLRNNPEKGFNREPVEIEGMSGVVHDDVVAGNGLAAAMSHMSKERRELYKKNMLEAAGSDPAARAQREKELALADRELAASEARLSRARKQVAEKFGINPNSDEAGIYARDLVYGQTMREVKALDTKIAKLEQGSPEWKDLQAKRERLMNQASRDGIQAYTDAAGLDVLVTRMQGKTHDDGSTLTIDELWNDPNFSRNGELSHLSKQQLDNMMNDQTMMISEHLDAFMNGTETPHQTARALAKYGQRAALVAKLNGMDLPPDHPLRKLYEEASKLMAHKGDPEAMRKALAALAGEGGTARDGLNKLKDMVEGAVPGLKGYTAAAPPSRPANVPPGFSSLNNYRSWLRKRDELYNRGGQPAVNRWLYQQRKAVENRREELHKEKAEIKKLSKDFLPGDFRKARLLLDRLDSVKEQLCCYPLHGDGTPGYFRLLREKADLEGKIKELKDKRDAWVKEHGELAEHPDLAQIDKELAALEEKADMLDEALESGSHPPTPKPNDDTSIADKDKDTDKDKDGDLTDLEKDFDDNKPPKTEKATGNKGITGRLNDAFDLLDE